MKRSIAGKQVVLVALAVAVVAAGGFVTYHHYHHAEPAGHPTSPINYGPPTAQQKADSQARKAANAQAHAQASAPAATSSPGTPAAAKKPVTPVITNTTQDGSSVLITAYVPNLLEDGGSCTVTATQAGQSVTKTGPASVNVSTTNCAPFNFSRSDFDANGDWQVVVAYSSATASGVSQPGTLTLK